MTQPLTVSARMPTRGQRVARSLRILGVCFFAVASVHASDTAPAAQPDEPEPAAEAAPPKTVVRIFGDIDWRSRRDDVPSTFVLGQIDVFLTSELAPNLSVLAETVLESPKGDSDAQIAEVERFQLQYSPVDAFAVSVGRMHTMLGFWNQAYHHGTWLQTTAFRPEIYRFEDDDGGWLPVHEVGVRLSGAASIHPLRFEYAASLVNGRASDPTRVLTFQDENGAKAVHLWAGISPRALPHLQFGGAAVFDTIPPDSAGARPPLDEKIWGGFVVFQGSRLEVLAELFSIHHRDKAVSVEWKSRGLYAQGAWEFGRWKPYYRYDWVDRDEGDPYYPAVLQDVDKHTIGLRVDPWSRLALKVEASRARLAGGEPFNAAAIQAAFTF